MTVPVPMDQVVRLAQKLQAQQLEAMGRAWRAEAVDSALISQLGVLVKWTPGGSLWAQEIADRAGELVRQRFGPEGSWSVLGEERKRSIQAIAVAVQGAAWAATMYAAGAITDEQYAELGRPWHAAFTSEGTLEP